MLERAPNRNINENGVTSRQSLFFIEKTRRSSELQSNQDGRFNVRNNQDGRFASLLIETALKREVDIKWFLVYLA
jgi:hypothetical protein